MSVFLKNSAAGKPLSSFIVNYTPDSAVSFDLDGNPVEHFARAYTPGQVELFLGRRKVPAKTFAKVLWIGGETGDE